MKKVELYVLGLLIIGLLFLSIGSVLYVRKVMLEYAVDLELQLAVFGFFMILLALMFSKIASRLVFNE
ncbi:MAG: hypothetical protein QW193_01165 [Nitrososphaerales archaeon]